MDLISKKTEIEVLWRKRSKKTKETKPMSIRTMVNAQGFLDKLSAHCLSNPEIDCSPDGDVTFDLESEKGQLTILIDEQKMYFWAKSKNGRRFKMNEDLNLSIPIQVIEFLEFLF